MARVDRGRYMLRLDIQTGGARPRVRFDAGCRQPSSVSVGRVELSRLYIMDAVDGISGVPLALPVFSVFSSLGRSIPKACAELRSDTSSCFRRKPLLTSDCWLGVHLTYSFCGWGIVYEKSIPGTISHNSRMEASPFDGWIPGARPLS